MTTEIVINNCYCKSKYKGRLGFEDRPDYIHKKTALYCRRQEPMILCDTTGPGHFGDLPLALTVFFHMRTRAHAPRFPEQWESQHTVTPHQPGDGEIEWYKSGIPLN